MRAPHAIAGIPDVRTCVLCVCARILRSTAQTLTCACIPRPPAQTLSESDVEEEGSEGEDKDACSADGESVSDGGEGGEDEDADSNGGEGQGGREDGLGPRPPAAGRGVDDEEGGCCGLRAPVVG